MNHTKAIEDADNAHADRYAEQLGRELAKATAETVADANSPLQMQRALDVVSAIVIKRARAA